MCLFIGIHLWCQTVPGFVYLFFSLFLSFASHLSSVDRQSQRTGSFCLFDAFQSNNETSQTPKLDTIRRATKHVRGWSVRENLLTHDNRSSHPMTSLWFFSQLASLPNHSAQRRPLLPVFNYGMLYWSETIQERCNITRPTIF